MLSEYLKRAMERARYEEIDDPEPVFGTIPELQGVWAAGATLEECQSRLLQAVEDWLFFSIAKGLSIPPLGDVRIEWPERLAV